MASNIFSMESEDADQGPEYQKIAIAGGSIYLQGDRGVDLGSLTVVNVVERWDYRTGVFGQNRHSGFREEATFYQSNLVSKSGGIAVVTKEGAVDAQGSNFNAAGVVNLEGQDGVNVRAQTADVHYASREESGLGGTLGAIDEAKGFTQRAAVMQAQSNTSIRMYSGQGTVEGEGTILRAPEIDIYGDKGIHF